MLSRPSPRSQANRESFSAGTIGGSRGAAVTFDSTPSAFYFDSSYGGDTGAGTDSMANSRPGSTLTLSRGGTPGFGTPGFGTPASGASRPVKSSLKQPGGGVGRQPSTTRSLRDIEMAMRSVNHFGEDIEEEDEDENDDDDGGDSISPARRYQPGKR